jgi:hypothetical protein
VADSLSRTVFPDSIDGFDPLLESIGSIDSSGDQPVWIWKDSKGGYTELLAQRELAANSEPADSIEPDQVITQLITICNSSDVRIHHTKYSASLWYSDIYAYITQGTIPAGATNRLLKRVFLTKAASYKLFRGELFFKFRGVQKRYVLLAEVADILYKAHDSEATLQLKLRLESCVATTGQV